jgi:hypothetical protein
MGTVSITLNGLLGPVGTYTFRAAMPVSAILMSIKRYHGFHPDQIRSLHHNRRPLDFAARIGDCIQGEAAVVHFVLNLSTQPLFLHHIGSLRFKECSWRPRDLEFAGPPGGEFMYVPALVVSALSFTLSMKESPYVIMANPDWDRVISVSPNVPFFTVVDTAPDDSQVIEVCFPDAAPGPYIITLDPHGLPGAYAGFPDSTFTLTDVIHVPVTLCGTTIQDCPRCRGPLLGRLLACPFCAGRVHAGCATFLTVCPHCAADLCGL